jgi:hypothetical protein
MDIIEKLRKEKAERERVKAEAHQAALDYDPFANKGIFNGIGVDRGIGSLPQNKDYKPSLVDSNIPKKIEVKDVDSVAGKVAEIGQVVEGKYGMNIANSCGDLYKTALDVVRSWGISTAGIPDEMLDIQAHYFLLSMRERFIERYQTMLSCVLSVREYADFKEIPYATVANKVFARGGRGLNIIIIGGTKFILLEADDFHDWHKFLAKKGAKEMADHGKKGEAIYLASVAGDSNLAEYDSVLEFLSLYEGGIKPTGGRGISGKRGNFYDALRGRITMERFYELYDRWAKDVLKILPVPSRDFGKKVRKLGYRGYNSGGKRGVYFYRVDEEIVGSRVRQLKIPRRGSYPKAVKGWNEFEKMGGEIKK